MSISTSVDRLAEELARLPGIGPKTAERLTFHLLQASADDAMRLAQAIVDVKKLVRQCSRCFHLTEGEICAICADARRDTSVVCVVEQSRDLLALERTGAFRGLYHVLLGRIAPLQGMDIDRLTISALVQRVRQGIIKEVVIATNPTMEGEATALHLASVLSEHGVKVTRLARGLASGMSLEFANRAMLEDALAGRKEV